MCDGATLADTQFRDLSPRQAETVADTLVCALLNLAWLSEKKPEPLRVETPSGPIFVESDGNVVTARGGPVSDDPQVKCAFSYEDGLDTLSDARVRDLLNPAAADIGDLVHAVREWSALVRLQSAVGSGMKAGKPDASAAQEAYDAIRMARAERMLNAQL